MTDKDPKGKEEKVVDLTPYKLRTRKTNALFGIEINRSDLGEYEIDGGKGSGDDIQDYVLRESGLERQIQKNKILAAALQSPSLYLYKKNKDLDDIGHTLATYFAVEYQRLLKTGITAEKAREKATSFMNSQKEREMAIHNANFIFSNITSFDFYSK